MNQKVHALPRPPVVEIDNIRHLLDIAKHDKFLLKDTDVEAWAGSNEHDLIALHDRQPDRFTAWVRGSFLVWFHRVIGFYFMVSIYKYLQIVLIRFRRRIWTQG